MQGVTTVVQPLSSLVIPCPPASSGDMLLDTRDTSPCLPRRRFSTYCVIPVSINEMKCKEIEIYPWFPKAHSALRGLTTCLWCWAFATVDRRTSLWQYCLKGISVFNTLSPRQNGRRFTDDTFKRILLDENIRISIKISLKFVPKGPINNNSALVQIMAWRRSGDKPLSEPMMVSLLTHICVTRPQWVKVLTSVNVSENWTIVGWDNGLSPVRCHTII